MYFTEKSVPSKNLCFYRIGSKPSQSVRFNKKGNSFGVRPKEHLTFKQSLNTTLSPQLKAAVYKEAIKYEGGY